MYSMSPITRGPPSWPRSTPVENVHATRRSLTFSALICLSELWRWFCMLPACIAQFFASWLSLMTSELASASPGRAARPSKTPHVHVRVSTISFSFACCLAEHAAALAAEALEARRGRSFHEIVIGVLPGDLVDHACALVEELLLAGVPLHALEDILDPVYGGIVMPVSGLGRGTPRQHRQGK